MSRFWCLALLMVSPALAAQQAPEEGDPVNAAISAYYDCVVGYSVKFAKTPESSGDIAQAAMSFCTDQRSAVRAAMSKSSSGRQLSFSDVTEALKDLEVYAGRLATRRLLEVRYPKLAPLREAADDHPGQADNGGDKQAGTDSPKQTAGDDKKAADSDSQKQTDGNNPAPVDSNSQKQADGDSPKPLGDADPNKNDNGK